MIDSGDLPAHVAIIMDGNGRWAKQRGMPRIEGHRVGIERAEEIIAASRELGIKYLTLFAFSTENWSRPEEEVSFLMSLLREYLEFKEKELVSQDIKFNVIGRISLLPKDVVSVVERVKKTTHRCGSMVLTLALSYGGRAEIVDATKKLALRLSAGDISVDDIDEELFSKFIYSPWIPDPDLLIRTGGELRISNFMLWELAYTELYFTETLWPDFTKEHFFEAIKGLSEKRKAFRQSYRLKV